jgi:signal transduction histidine kinase
MPSVKLPVFKLGTRLASLGQTIRSRLSMLRARLGLVMAVSMGFIVFLVLTLYFGTEQVANYFKRTQEAYEAFGRYQDLSHTAYRHFKHRMDLHLADSETSRSEVELSRQRLFAALERLKAAAESGARDAPRGASKEARLNEQPASLQYAARLSAFLDSTMYQFDQAEKLRQQGRRDESLAVLTKILKEDIDRQFEPLIDSAMADEREQALVSRERMAALMDKLQWIGTLAAAFAAIFSIVAGSLLFRGIRRPIEALMRGTDEIAAGNLAYRIALNSQDEFGYLSHHFDQMAEGLQKQQAALLEASNVLEQKVEERTRQLHDAIDEQSRMDNARRQFFADISHELRTPLTVIRGEAEVTLRGRDKDPEEYKEALHRVQTLAMQLGKLVNDLLFMARAETANLQFEWEAVDASELLANVAEDVKVLAADKAIAVSVDIGAEPAWVRGDQQRLRQVFFILGDNACRYSKANSEIDIRLEIHGTQVAISFHDRGIGIAPNELDLIFDRYYRSANARNSVEDGTGLGLPVAKTIVKAHNGHISATSSEDSGTTFMVALPMIREDENPKGHHAHS